jgi:hypothetical protein
MLAQIFQFVIFARLFVCNFFRSRARLSIERLNFEVS